MGTVNIILIIIGILIAILGIVALIYPNLTRIINAPGGPQLKAIIALIIGLIILIFGIFNQSTV